MSLADALAIPLTSGSEPALRPLKPLLPLVSPIPLWPFALLVALVAGVVAAVLVLRWRKRHRAGLAEPTPTTAGEQALRALDQLAAASGSEERARRETYFELSAVVRRYLEARFDFNATDLTREEILCRLGSLRGLPAAEAVRLRHFLSETDDIKFAARLPSREQTQQALGEARRFVLATSMTPAERAA